MATNDKVVDWTTLKAIRTAKNNTPFQYTESSVKYDIWIQDGTQVYTTELWIDTNAVEGINVTQNNTDKTDWETNYKAGARGLVPTDVNVQNTVNVNLTGGSVDVTAETIRYQPRFFASNTSASVNETDTELVNLSFDGQFSAITINFSHNVEISLSIDGTEILRETVDNLSAGSVYNLSNTGKRGFPIEVSPNSKQIFINYYSTPADVLTNLTIKAKAFTSAVTCKGLMVVYRQKVAV